MKHVMLFVLIAMSLLFCGCSGGGDGAARYTPLAETVGLQTEVLDLVQYGSKTISVSADAVSSYDCETAETLSVALPTSETVILNLFEDMLYIFDDATDIMYMVSPETLEVVAEQSLALSDVRILYGAVGQTDYIFFGIGSETRGYFLVNRTDGTVTEISNNLDIWALESMTEDKILVYIGALSSDKARIAVYHMEDNTYEEQLYYTNSLSVTRMAYNKARHAVIYMLAEGYVYTTYSLSLEDGTIETVDIFKDEALTDRMIATDGNLSVICKNGTTLLYTDMDDDSNTITIATAGNTMLTMQDIADAYSIETGVLVNVRRYVDTEKFDLALMAGNTDADILYVSELMAPANYVRNEACDDLWNYSEFADLPAEKTEYLRFAAQTDEGKLIGVPVYIQRRDTESTYLAVLLSKYFDDNVDLLNRQFRDPDGTALHAIYDAYWKYVDNGREFPTDAKMFTEYRSGFYMLYAGSEKKELAVSFLAYINSFMLGESPLSGNTTWALELYPESIDSERSFVMWKSYDTEIYREFSDILFDVLEDRSIADERIAEAVAKLKMMILE